MQTYSLCDATIDMRTPKRRERVRDFQPPWRTVFVYVCPKCANERRVRASAFRGKVAEPSVGAIVCGAYLPGGAK